MRDITVMIYYIAKLLIELIELKTGVQSPSSTQ